MSYFIIIIQRNHLYKFLPNLVCIKTLYKKENRKMPNIISKEQDEAIKYFRNKLNLSDKDLYIPLINFELLRDKNEQYANILYELYKNDPYLFIRALKEGYVVNQPIKFDEAIVRFFNGEELAIVHKTTGRRYNVNVKMKKLPDGFTLQTMDMWLWSEIV